MTLARKLRGIRDSMPGGYFLGRLPNAGKGPPQLIKVPAGIITPSGKANIGQGNGNVLGPASSTSGDIATFGDASGKLLADSGKFFDTDGTLAANSDARIATQKAVKTYVDAHAGSGQQVYASFTTPVDGNFAWINQGGASVTVNANGGIYLTAPASATHSVRLRKLTAPATPYTITAAILINNVLSNFTESGLAFRESSSGKLATIAIVGATALSGCLVENDHFTDATTFSAAVASVPFLPPGLVWLQIRDDGTNRKVGWSVDGYNFTQLSSEGRTTFLTADEVGFFSNSINASWPASCTLLSWAQT